MPDKQRRWGQYFTAPEVADLLLGLCLRQPGDRVLDPSCGQGAFLSRAAYYQRWLANSGSRTDDRTLWGVEIDPVAAGIARESLVADGFAPQILVRDFFSLRPGDDLPDSFDCIVGNPPYTRSEWLGRGSGDQDYKETLAQVIAPVSKLGRRSGLHAYFFVHGFKFLRPRGRFGFVVSNSWLDVHYGIGLKHFLLSNFKIIAIIESAVEKWFSQAEVNTCLVILEKCEEESARSYNQVRFVRILRPLSDFLTSSPDSPSRAVEVEGFIMRLLPGRSRLTDGLSVRVLSQGDLQADQKWGPYLRAPDIYFRTVTRPGTIRLGEIATVERGQTTGANRFFYFSAVEGNDREIEPEFTMPLLKSPKELDRVHVNAADLGQRVLTVESVRERLVGSKVLRYIEWGESENYHKRSTCARRSPWYRLAEKANHGERIVWVKGIWTRHFAPLLDGQAMVDQQFYTIRSDPSLMRVLAALLNSTWVALQAELLGRSNFGEGVLWLAAYEVSSMRIPNPQMLSAVQSRSLGDAFVQLSGSRVLPIADQVLQPAQQALDNVVFDILGLTADESKDVVRSAIELTEARVGRARAGRSG